MFKIQSMTHIVYMPSENISRMMTNTFLPSLFRFQYQHPLYTGKQSEPKHLTPYSMSTMDRAKYGVYADIYVTPDFMDYGKVDVGKKKKFKKHSKIFGRK